MTNIAIKVENLSKRYRIGAEEKRPEGFWDAAKQAALSPFDYLRRITRPPTDEETLWALRDEAAGAEEDVGRLSIADDPLNAEAQRRQRC